MKILKRLLRCISLWRIKRVYKSKYFGIYRTIQNKSGEFTIQEYKIEHYGNIDGGFTSKEWVDVLSLSSIAVCEEVINKYRSNAAYKYFKNKRREKNARRRQIPKP